jgi:hypothetical protein
MADKVEAVFAVYGAIMGNGWCRAWDVKAQLQKLLDKNPTAVTINNENMAIPGFDPDPVPRCTKHFGAFVTYSGDSYPRGGKCFVACQEGQTINFFSADIGVPPGPF